MLFDYTKITADDVTTIAGRAIDEAEALVAAALSGERTWEGTMSPLNEMAAAMTIAGGRSAFLGRAHPDDAVREAATAADERMQKFASELDFRSDLYEAVKEYAGTDEAEGLEVGAEVKCDIFEAGQKVDAIGMTKGMGTAGVIKRHNFAVKRRTHGTHENHRHGGAIGAGAYPGKVIKGMKMSGRMGNERVTTRNLEVVRVDTEKNLVLIRGAVPGHNNGLVRIRPALTAKA